MSFCCEFNQNNTSATGGFGGERGEIPYIIPQKHCGGMTKCGLPCHKGIHCTVVDSFQKDGKTVYKYYCRKCKEFGEGSPEDGCK